MVSQNGISYNKHFINNLFVSTSNCNSSKVIHFYVIDMAVFHFNAYKSLGSFSPRLLSNLTVSRFLWLLITPPTGCVYVLWHLTCKNYNNGWVVCFFKYMCVCCNIKIVCMLYCCFLLYVCSCVVVFCICSCAEERLF